MHHTAYRCADVAEAIEQCRSRGLRMIDEQPRRGIRDSLVAFVHPASTGGVLTELVQPAEGSPLMARDSGEVRRVEVGFSGGQVITDADAREGV